MSGPIFMTVAIDPQVTEGFWVVDLSPVQARRIGTYMDALATARDSQVAKPIFSNYFCKECATSVHGSPVPAGNIEYGFLQALHGEEAAVAAFRSLDPGAQGKDIVLGFYTSDARVIRPDNPCGNCRDIMRENFGEDFEIVSGNPDGEIALVTPMSIYLFDDYQPVVLEHGKRVDAIRRTFSAGKYLENDFYSSGDVYPRRKYYASIKTAQRYYYGAHDVMCDFHPIYALRDAVRQARRNHDPYVEEVWIIGENIGGEPPDVMYKDRQHLHELNLQQELLLGEERNPTVFLATYDHAIGPVAARIWRTTVKEWLPFPFTARNFMDLAAMTKYFKHQEQQ